MNDSHFIEPSSASHPDQFQSQKEELKQHKTQLLSEQVLNFVIPRKNTVITTTTMDQLDSGAQSERKETLKSQGSLDTEGSLPLSKAGSEIVPASETTLMVENLDKKVKLVAKPEAKQDDVKIEIKTEGKTVDKIERYSFVYMCLVVISVVGFLIGVIYAFDSEWQIEPKIGTILLAIIVVANFLFALEAVQSKNADRQLYVFIVFCIVLFVNTIAVMHCLGLQVEYFKNLDSIASRILIGLLYVVNLALVRLAGLLRTLMQERDNLLKVKPKIQYKAV